MEIVFLPKADDDLALWKKSGNIILQNKIHSLLTAIKASPFEGIGKPEPLRYNLTGKWSRRKNSEHRIIYEVLESEQIIKIHSLRGHYY